MVTTGKLAAQTGRTEISETYEVLLLEKRGERVSPASLAYYRYQLSPFLDWLSAEGVEGFSGLSLTLNARLPCVSLKRPPSSALPDSGESILSGHKAVKSFLRWAAELCGLAAVGVVPCSFAL